MVTCLVFTCGPSLAKYVDFVHAHKTWIQEARNHGLLKVICVKQTVHTFHDICDYHVYNQVNLDVKSLKYPEIQHVFAGIPGEDVMKHPNRYIGHKLIITRSTGGLMNTMCANGDFREIETAYEKKNVMWGPGIIYEGVMSVAAHLGCTKMFLFGWDMFPPGEFTKAHFGGSYGPEPTAGTIQEAALVVYGSKPLYEFARTKLGMELAIVGTDSHVSEVIPRWTCEQVFLDLLSDLHALSSVKPVATYDYELVCLVPIKRNNQRLPGKNTKELHGKPLCRYLLDTLVSCKGFDKIVVYCSDPTIQAYLPEGVDFLLRSTSLDTDETQGIDIYTAFSKEVKSRAYLLAHVTSPFVRKETIEKTIQQVRDRPTSVDTSIIAVTPIQKYCYYENAPINFQSHDVVRTQLLRPVEVVNSAFFVFTYEMLSLGLLLSRNPCLVACSSTESIDIDTIEDFILAEAVAKAGAVTSQVSMVGA